MNVMLIGARASGKSTLARIIGNALWRPVVDMDDMVLAQFAEATVSEVWAAHGEAAWREAEARVAPEILMGDEQVIAAGGGAPIVPQVQAAIEAARDAGRLKVIYLSCDPVELHRRLVAQQADRPSLTGQPAPEEIEVIIAQRDAIYRAVADAVVDVSHLSERDAADYLVRHHL